ncbi:MAG: hypothetical protein J6S71_01870 [Clostridia bacterium]|nr:hypothetical protein [Clostridia bacterium]
MKTNDFFEAMGNIDADLIERADKTAVKPRPFIKIAAIAAAIALLVTGMLVILPMFREDENEPDENIVGDAIVWSNVFELFNPNTGSGVNEEAAFLESSSFAEIETKKYSKYDLGNAFPLDKNDEFFGEKLDEIKVRTGWYVYYNDTERDVVTVKAEVYEIKGVSTDAAVAVKYLEKGTEKTTEHFYAALNTEYEFTTLADFLSDFNAAVHMDIGKDALVTEYPRFNSKKIDKYRVTEGGSDIVKFLLTLDGAAEVAHPYDAVDGRMNNCGEIRRVTFLMASAGKMMNSLYIFDNGYIAIGGPICDGIIFFNVGGEATSELYEIFKANTELVTVINPDSTVTDGIVEATTSAPANEVVPE